MKMKIHKLQFTIPVVMCYEVYHPTVLKLYLKYKATDEVKKAI